MKSILIILILVTFSVSGFCQEWNLVWEDNFTADSLDLRFWNYETGTGVNGDFGTGQLDRATDRLENVSFLEGIPGAEDACLVITTRKERYIDRDYTSGRLNTSGKVSWGPGHRIVARVYPRDVRYKGQGFAFWMMPDEIPDGWDYIMWPQGGEVDIMEYVGSIPYHNLGSVHYAWFWENNQWQSWNHGHQGAYYSFEDEQVPNPEEPGYGNYPPPEGAEFAGSSNFHLYGIDWYEDRMEFFVDSTVYHINYFEDGGAFNVDGEDQKRILVDEETGKRVASSEYSHHFSEWYPFEHKMYLILSAGVGGSQYTYGGAIIPEAEFPASVFIDWVRVYEYGESVSTEPADSDDLPSEIHLKQNYPNPFNPSTNIEFSLPETKNVRLEVFNTLGEKVSTLVNNTMSAGEHKVVFEAENLTSGIYFYRIQTGDFMQVNKMLLIK